MATLKFYPSMGIAVLSDSMMTMTIRKGKMFPLSRSAISEKLKRMNYYRSKDWEKVNNHYETKYSYHAEPKDVKEGPWEYGHSVPH